MSLRERPQQGGHSKAALLSGLYAARSADPTSV